MDLQLETPGFSYFAITANEITKPEEADNIVNPEDQEHQQNEVNNPVISPEIDETINIDTSIIGAVVLVIALILLGVIAKQKSGKKHKKK